MSYATEAVAEGEVQAVAADDAQTSNISGPPSTSQSQGVSQSMSLEHKEGAQRGPAIGQSREEQEPMERELRNDSEIPLEQQEILDVQVMKKLLRYNEAGGGHWNFGIKMACVNEFKMQYLLCSSPLFHEKIKHI